VTEPGEPAGAGLAAMSLRRWDAVRLAACLAGLAISIYLTLLHYFTSVPLACPATGAVDCASVLTSPQAVVLGIPVAAWGLLWFLVASLLAAAALRRGTDGEPAGLRRASLIWALIGAAVVVYLVYAELVLVGRICLWCTAVHILVLFLFVLQVVTDPQRAAD
jgi:uncharacterized membrane protein